MTLTLEFSPAEGAKLLQKAEAKGVPVEEMLRDAALGMIRETADNGEPLSAQEFQRRISELQKYLPKDLPSISSESLRRENLYADED